MFCFLSASQSTLGVFYLYDIIVVGIVVIGIFARSTQNAISHIWCNFNFSLAAAIFSI